MLKKNLYRISLILGLTLSAATADDCTGLDYPKGSYQTKCSNCYLKATPNWNQTSCYWTLYADCKKKKGGRSHQASIDASSCNPHDISSDDAGNLKCNKHASQPKWTPPQSCN